MSSTEPTSTQEPAGPAPAGVPRGPSAAWTWLALAGALVAVVMIRVPLVLNARSALDSDLAVDGITLAEALRGHWRWHYPATPTIGTPSLAVMLPIGAVMGATPTTLGVAGVAIYGLVVVATFALALRVFGRGVACWALVPLAFASTGTIWLSGRITGGHLLAVAWHATAFALLYALLTRGGPRRAAALGLWCGLGLWNDSLFAITLVGLVPVGVLAWFRSGMTWRGVAMALLVVTAAAIGQTPKLIGRWADPYDRYQDTFEPTRNPELLLHHLQILVFDCIPRLIIGHRLPHFEAEPGGIWLDGQPLPARGGMTTLGAATFLLGFGLLAVAVANMGARERPEPPPSSDLQLVADDQKLARAEHIARWAVRWGLLTSATAVTVAFVANHHIYNSDNYRYLVFLLVPWALGFGRVLNDLATKGIVGVVAAATLAVAFAVAFTLDTAAWYREMGWISDRGRIVVRNVPDPILGWLDAHPEVDGLYGGYWDVYRYTLLTGGRVRGVPSAFFPDRFPEWTAAFHGGRPTTVIARSMPPDQRVRRMVERGGGTCVLHTNVGEVWDWPLSATPNPLLPTDEARRPR